MQQQHRPEKCPEQSHKLQPCTEPNSPNDSPDNHTNEFEQSPARKNLGGGCKKFPIKGGWVRGILTNIQGLYPKSNTTKIPYLKDLATESNLLFMALTESHLSDQVIDAEIQISNYNVFRIDRKDRSHGGVIVYTKDSLCIKEIAKNSNSYCEFIILEFPDINLVLTVIYRPPNCPEQAFRDSLESIKNYLCNYENKGEKPWDLLLMGDFNFPFIEDWNSDGPFINTEASEKKQAVYTKQLSGDLFMEQLVQFPTRKSNILDLIFSNNVDLITNIETIVNSGISDHNTIEFTLGYDLEAPNSMVSKGMNIRESKLAEMDVDKASEEDWQRINVGLSKVNWNDELLGLNTEESLEKIVSEVEKIVTVMLDPKKGFEDDSVFEVEGETKSNNKIPRKARILMRRKRKISKNIIQSTSNKRIVSLTEDLNIVDNEIRTMHNEFSESKEREALESIKKDPSKFYKYANKKSKVRTSIGPLSDKDGNPISDPKEIAEILSDQYKSVFSTPQEESKIENEKEFFNTENPEENHLTDIFITDDEVKDAISDMKSSASAGPDGFPAIILKKCSENLSIPLADLFNKSLQSSSIPNKLKEAFVIPIHKGNSSKNVAANYRPVSLTSNIIKTMERILRKHMIKHLENQGTLNDRQHGFREKRSCLSQLLTHFDETLNAIERGNNCDAIYLDFSKAFDKCDHGILKNKLKEAKISGRIGTWIGEFLRKRTQKVIVDNNESNEVEVESGVPQGSVLGPILFLILINDISSEVNQSKVSLFADDTRIFNDVNSPEAVEALQADLDSVYEWQEKNNMIFNATKFELIRYGPDDNLKNETVYFTPEMSNIIERKSYLRDLGVVMADDFTFRKHIDQIQSKVTKKAGWVLRNFKTRSSDFMKQIWKSLIQPHVDYCSILWFSPNNAGELAQIESLQRRFTRRIENVQDFNYWERLQYLRLYSQQRRLERYRIIYTWKCIEGLVPNCNIRTYNSGRRGRLCAIPPLVSSSSCRSKSIRENSFQINGPKLFNCLPVKVREISNCSVDTFKFNLDSILSVIPDEPRCDNLIPRSVCIYTSKPSNSIIDQIRIINFQTDLTVPDDR